MKTTLGDNKPTRIRLIIDLQEREPEEGKPQINFMTAVQNVTSYAAQQFDAYPLGSKTETNDGI